MPTRSLKHLVRDTLISAFSYAGVSWLYRKAEQKNGVLTRIVVFHDVPDAVWFEFMIQTLSERFHIITPEEFIAGVRVKGRVNVLVTFDDGYASWQTVALPILARYGVRGLFFVNSGLVACAHDRGKADAFMRDALGIEPRAPLMREGLQALKDAGHVIGGHSQNHKNLALLSHEDLQKEIARDKEELESLLGTPVIEFAYPFGTRAHVNDSAEDAVKAAGYARGYTAISRFVPPQATFSIPRMCIEDGLTPPELVRWVNGAYDIFCLLK